MKKAINKRWQQKIFLSISLLIVLIGIYGMFTKGFEWMFRLPSHSMGNRFNLPFVILFVLALITAYFSARNLLPGKKDKNN